MLRQIDRARYAVRLLTHGMSIADTIYAAGYYDQPHLTRLLKSLIGFTPAQLASPARAMPLSFLYKTSPLLLDDNVNIPFATEGEQKCYEKSESRPAIQSVR